MINTTETLSDSLLANPPLSSTLPLTSTEANDVSTGSSGTQVAFVDSTLANVESLIDTLTDATVYVIDAQQDGVGAISDALSQLQQTGTDIGSVHIFAHGSAGALQLGATTLTADNLVGYSDDLAVWGQSQSQDVLLYGCNVAEGATGNAFVNQLVAMTGADIQASNDLTGSVALGGDWDLEVSAGEIESGLAISVAGQQSYMGTLASPTITSNGGSATAAVTVDEGTSFVTDVSVTGANGYSEGFGVEYYFSGGQDSYLFDIDVNTGVVAFRGDFDFNNPTDADRNNVYDINILAIDWTGASDTQAIAVTVEAATSAFGIEGDSTLSVSEGSTAVTDFNVTGAANGFNENFGVEYYFFGGQDSYLFNLNNNTGELSFRDAPDFGSPTDSNRDNVYDVGILAIDYSGNSQERAFSVVVQESASSFGIEGGSNISVNEGSTAVTDLNVTGAANGFNENFGVEYYFFGGQDSYLFNLNNNTGELSFRDAPDFESPTDSNRDNVYDVGVLAIDYSGNSQERSLSIAVQDVTESGNGSPVITSNGGGDSAVIEVNEGNAAVTDVTTTGANGFSEGNGFTYILNAGDDANAFNIDPNTGVISFKSAPDFENPTDADGNNVYFANVLVQDPAGQADSQFLSIVVKDVTEGGSAPVITSGGGGDFALVKAAENQTLAVDVQTTDADGEQEGSGITYRINDGADASLFNIDANTGVVSFKSAPDFENASDADGNNLYEINVLATDSTGRADSQFIQVQVTNQASVYLLGGQSNMAGDQSDKAFLVGRPQGSPLPAVQIWDGGFNSFTALRTGFNNNFGVGDGFGAEVGFGHALEALRANGQLDNNEEIYLAKYAIGATSLAQDWRVNGNNNRYDEFNDWVGDALANLAAADIGYTVEGMLWMQGENDSINAGAANQYQRNLDNLIGDVRSRYGQELDFVIGRLHEELPSGFYTQTDTVRAAQVNVANSNPKNEWIDTDDLPISSDSVHFDSSGHLALGERFAGVFAV